MVTVVDAVAVPSVTEVATTVTVPPVGTFAGAVYVVAEPLAVFAGLKLPHEDVPQVTDHVTPAFALSPVTNAVKGAVVPAVTVDGIEPKFTLIPAGGLGPLPPPPHAAATNAIAATPDIKIVLRDFTAHPP
jgi:hypothetical protein